MKKESKNCVKECRFLLHQFNKNRKKMKAHSVGELLAFRLKSSEKKLTVYNPTKPFLSGDKTVILGRVEHLDSENSTVIPFVEKDGAWHEISGPNFNMQDPFHIENIQGFHVLGGVRIFEKLDKGLGYQTVFYRYKNRINELFDRDNNVIKPFATGPIGMKDIRLIDLKNGKIAVFTRPQGGTAGLGKIGYIEIENLDQLEDAIPRARLLELFHQDEWGGANELHLLENGKIGVLGHIAHFEGSLRHYYAMSFVFDPESQRVSKFKILTTADEFPAVPSKKASLGKIIFSGGLIRHDDRTADLYVGIGDTHAGKIKINDPFDRI